MFNFPQKVLRLILWQVVVMATLHYISCLSILTLDIIIEYFASFYLQDDTWVQVYVHVYNVNST